MSLYFYKFNLIFIYQIEFNSIYTKKKFQFIMNLEVIVQLTVLALIVLSGPLVITLLAINKGNL